MDEFSREGDPADGAPLGEGQGLVKRLRVRWRMGPQHSVERWGGRC